MFKVSLPDAQCEEIEQINGETPDTRTASLNMPAALRQSGIGFIIIDPVRKTLFFNREALSILGKAKGVAPGPHFLKSLPSVVHQAIIPKPSNALPLQKVLFKSGRRQYSIWTIPLFGPDNLFDPSASKQRMVILERSATEGPNLPLLTRNFKLTPREGHVVKLLLRGRSDKLIGRALGISVETVREHMRNIRSKMGAASRLEVVSFLLSA